VSHGKVSLLLEKMIIPVRRLLCVPHGIGISTVPVLSGNNCYMVVEGEGGGGWVVRGGVY